VGEGSIEGIAPNATFVLDLSRPEENAMEFAQHVFGGDESRYHPWWKAACAELEKGKWRDVLARPEVAEYRGKDTPKGVRDPCRYIWRNRDAVDYPTYRKKGYFVGSGAIESGNKTVMQERPERAGMMWTESSAEMLLALRAKHGSEQWESVVEPLVRRKYRTHHLLEGNVREAQREAHGKRKAEKK